MQVVIPCEYVLRKPCPSPLLIGSEAKNPLPTSEEKQPEGMGLSCLVADDFFLTIHRGGGK